MRNLIFAAVVVILLWAAWAQADRIRTQAGIGYEGKIVGMDAGGLVLEYAGGKRTVPLVDIVSIRIDQYPDLEKAEDAYAKGLAGGLKAAEDFAEAERLYRELAQQELPQWLRVLVDTRMNKLYAESGRVPEALDTTVPPPEKNSSTQTDPKRIATVEQSRTLLNNLVEGLTKTQDPALTTAQSQVIIQETFSRCRTALALKPFLEFQTSVEDVVPQEESDWCRIRLGSPLGIPQELQWRTRLDFRLQKDKALLLRKGQTAILRGKASLVEKVPPDTTAADAWLTGTAGASPYSIALESVTCRFLSEEDRAQQIGADVGPISPVENIEIKSGEFFGMPIASARRIVYVVDRSGSMTDAIDYVKFELKRSIRELGEGKEFHVIFYSSGPPVEMPTRRLVNATDRNKELAVRFIDSVVAQGQTDPSKALERAFDVKPELIYLLTDGEFDKAIVGLVKRLNAAGKVKVHTIGFLYRMGEKGLKQIADQNGGQYKFVAEKDLADLMK